MLNVSNLKSLLSCSIKLIFQAECVIVSFVGFFVLATNYCVWNIGSPLILERTFLFFASLSPIFHHLFLCPAVLQSPALQAFFRSPICNGTLNCCGGSYPIVMGGYPGTSQMAREQFGSVLIGSTVGFKTIVHVFLSGQYCPQ